MMAHNLCYTTLVDKISIDHYKLEKDKDYIQTPNNGERLLAIYMMNQFSSSSVRFLRNQFQTEGTVANNS